jgi:DNA-nicking Smr family endonuclease
MIKEGLNKQAVRKRRQTKYQGVVNPEDSVKRRLRRKPPKELLDYNVFEYGLDKALTMHGLTSSEAEKILFGIDDTEEEPSEGDND